MLFHMGDKEEDQTLALPFPLWGSQPWLPRAEGVDETQERSANGDTRRPRGGSTPVPAAGGGVGVKTGSRSEIRFLVLMPGRPTFSSPKCTQRWHGAPSPASPATPRSCGQNPAPCSDAVRSTELCKLLPASCPWPQASGNVDGMGAGGPRWGSRAAGLGAAPAAGSAGAQAWVQRARSPRRAPIGRTEAVGGAPRDLQLFKNLLPGPMSEEVNLPWP